MSVLHTLPPTAPPMGATDLLNGLFGLFSGTNRQTALTGEIEAEFGVKHAWVLGSGKAALTVILEALTALSGRTEVIVPAYTCFSVPASVRKAGLTVVPCDIDPHRFDFDPVALARAIGPDTLCIVPSNLFGIPSNIAAIRKAIGRKAIWIVEDAAQAMGVEAADGKVGTRGDVGFFSLGRGKQISCGAGGIIVTARDDVAHAVSGRLGGLPDPGFFSGLRMLLEVTATFLLIHPLLYGIPARLPFLALGRTHYPDDFPVRALTRAQAGLLAHWKARLSESLECRGRAVAQYRKELPGAAACQLPPADLPLLRLPLLAPDRGTRERICKEGGAQDMGIGGFYPSALGQVPQVAAHLENTGRKVDTPVADDVAGRLFTVPTHHLLSPADRTRIARHLSRYFDGAAP